ncbi:uncharacterized protein A4U43_UnF1440 [Asparagus officinalis]|uniref:Uncharacterized protein n=1 Tax=Asparagus officinalis TaxID=4686 RepID=A0A1R3L7H8_ASPOF|nr:uncharacterized protein LOC109827160 isoform X1 [Asparagus officinalis]ONK55579.1 uncharacterized protein A4U43_UnF1440 [Asparagus officinalis]
MAPANESAPASSRYSNLKKSFHLGARSLLTAFSKEDVDKVFSTFTEAERERLYRMIIQVIKSLHENIEDEFESICQETQVGAVLDKIEQLIEEQNLDILSTDRKNIDDVKEKISRAKLDEVKYLTNLLEKAEEQNNIMSARIRSLKERQQDQAVTADVVEKFKSWTSSYGGCH